MIQCSLDHYHCHEQMGIKVATLLSLSSVILVSIFSFVVCKYFQPFTNEVISLKLHIHS